MHLHRLEEYWLPYHNTHFSGARSTRTHITCVVISAGRWSINWKERASKFFFLLPIQPYYCRQWRLLGSPNDDHRPTGPVQEERFAHRLCSTRFSNGFYNAKCQLPWRASAFLLVVRGLLQRDEIHRREQNPSERFFRELR